MGSANFLGVTSKRSKILRNYAHSDLVRQVFPDITAGEEIVCSINVEEMGFSYQKGYAILIELTNDDFPTFGEIVEIVVWDQKKIIYSALETNTYESRLNAYEVEASEPTVYNAVTIDNLPSKHPLPPSLKYGSKVYVILTYHCRTEVLG